MKIKEQTIQALEDLEPADIFRVYELIQAIKGGEGKLAVDSERKAYLQVRHALSGCEGNLSTDIGIARDERI